MRFRRSHEIRRQLDLKTRPASHRLQRITIGAALFTLAAWSIWMVAFATDTSMIFGWLLRGQVDVAVAVDRQSEPYKTVQALFRDIDFGIARAMTNLQIAPDQVREMQAWQPGPDGVWLPAVRTLRISDFYAPAQTNLEFSRSIADAGGSVRNAEANSRNHELTFEVTTGSTVTHRLKIVPDASIERKVGHLALIIDDLEISDTEISQRFLRIERPLTFSINPWRASAEKKAREVDGQNQEVIIHLPMEPDSYPRISPGRHAVLVNQSPLQNKRVVQDAVAALPMARGVKNFMGSRATSQRNVMEPVLREVKDSNKYFVDSMTSSRSVAHKTAEQLEIPGGVSWGFLDAEDNQERIAARLDQASLAAMKDGPVILVARARANTLVVLEEKMQRLALRGIQFVHASTLVTGGKDAGS